MTFVVGPLTPFLEGIVKLNRKGKAKLLNVIKGPPVLHDVIKFLKPSLFTK